MIPRRLRSGVAATISLALVLAACGEDAPTDYTLETRENFLAACTESLTDSRLVTELCECTFAAAQEKLTFDRFTDLEARMKNNLDSNLGAAMNSALAECILQEADL